MGRKGIPIETHGLKTYWDNGVLRYEGGLRVLDPNRPSAKPFVPKSYSIFKHSSLDSIASLINLRPGDFISGDVEYGDDFIKDFNDSLAEEIKYEEGDSDSGLAVAAAVAGAIAGETDPAVPLGGAELLGLHGLAGRRLRLRRCQLC